MVGFVLVEGRYNPVAPDEDGRVLSGTLNLWVGLDTQGRVILEDAVTGERLLNSQEEVERRKAAEARLAEEQATRGAAAARLRRLEARLRESGVENEETHGE